MPTEFPIRRLTLLAFLAALALGCAGVAARGQETAVFSSPAPIALPDGIPAQPYPATLSVTGMPGVVRGVGVTLHGLHHAFPDDIDVLLVGPGGQCALLMSDAGGGTDVTNLTLTLDPGAAAGLPDTAALSSGRFRPSNFDSGGVADTFYEPAPPGPYRTRVADFYGTLPNGDWSLFVMDDAGGDSGGVAGGWSLELATVAPESVADVAVSVSEKKDPITADAKLVYTVAVTNLGPFEAQGVFVTNALPGPVTFLFATPSQGGCQLVGRAVVCDLGPMPVGAVATVLLGFAPNAEGPLTNRTVVATATADFNPENSEAVEITTVLPAQAIDLVLTAADRPDPVILGQNLVYELAVTNQGPMDATDVVLVDTLAPTVSFVAAAASKGVCNVAGNRVMCALGGLVRGEGATVAVTVRPNLVGVITNLAVVQANEFDISVENSTARTATLVYLPTDLSVQQLDSPDPASQGSNLTYTVSIHNNGPGPASGVVVSNILPSAVTFVGAHPSQGSCQVIGSDYVICSLGDLLSGQSATVTLTVVPTMLGNYFNTATACGNEADPHPANNVAREETTVFPGGDGIVVSPSMNALELATAITAAGGTGIRVRNATLQAHYQAGFTNFGFEYPASHSSGLYSVANPPHTYGLRGLGVILSTGDVAAYATYPTTFYGGSTAYDIRATTNQEALLDPITTTGGRNWTHFDVTQLDVQFDLLPGFDTVLFNVAFGSEEYPEYVNSSYVDGFGIYLNGVNIAYARGKPVNINHPDFRAIGGTELDGVLAPDNNPIVSFSQYLGSGATNNRLTFIVADTSDAVLDTTVYVSSLQGTLPQNADLAVSMRGPTNHVIVGSNVTYRITVTNQGPNLATATVLSNVLPAAMTFASATASQGACAHVSGTVICDLGILDDGYAATVTIVGVPRAPGYLTNAATVMSAQADFGATNNAASSTALALAYGTFVSTDAIAINDGAPATPYPVPLRVSGLDRVIGEVTVTLHQLIHPFPADLDVLLISPSQTAVLLMSDAGANVPLHQATLAFADRAAVALPGTTAIFSGLYRPTDYPPVDGFVPPAPAGPYAGRLDAFRGEDPNGEWRLYVMDDMGQDTGLVFGGWSLAFELETPLPALAIAVADGQARLSWPVSAEGFVLETKAQLSTLGAWAAVTNVPAQVDDRNLVTIGLADHPGFFRLRKPVP